MQTATHGLTPNELPSARIRISSIDIVRGLVMVIMAIDHLRDMLHLGHPEPTDLNTTTPALFFTRWVTHFCAPTFVFLSGISAFMASKRRTGNQMAGFLIKRGFWLIIVEIFIINIITSLDASYQLLVFQVISAIGGSMVIIGLLLWAGLSSRAIGIIGVLIIAGHNCLDLLHNQVVENNILWRIFFTSNGFGTTDSLGPNHTIIVSYALLPWTGVMMAGYAMGELYTQSAQKRKRILTTTGIGLLLIFIVFRAFNVYGDPAPWAVQKNSVLTVLSFLNVTKYPCSFLYLCITIGTALLLLAFTEKMSNRFSKLLIVYGNVPFFYYILHWTLAQTITIILFFSTGHHLQDRNTDITGFPFSPNNFGLSLPGMYLAWLVLVALLYFPCKWYGQYKRTHQHWWLSYL